jgi:hypothetical protein
MKNSIQKELYTMYLKEVNFSAPDVFAQLFNRGSTVSLKLMNLFTNCTTLHGANAALRFAANSTKSNAECPV